MTSLSFLNGSEITTLDRTIVEPIAAPLTVSSRLEQYFPDSIYSHSPNGLLYHFLTTLLGDSGTNSIKKQMLYPRLANSLFSTHFSDIDTFYGNAFGFQRIEEEIYTFNPLTQLLDEDAWQEIRRKDSWYRSRCLDYIQALQLGTTPDGLAALAKAASGIECSVFERWRYLDDQASDDIVGIPNTGKTSTHQEFTVIAHTTKLSPKQERRISNMLYRVKPANTTFSIVAQPKARIAVNVNGITSTSKHFQVKRLVTGNKQIKYPPIDPATGLWIEPGVEREAPSFAFNSRAESITWPTIESAISSSFHVGVFNLLQRSLFPHLSGVPNPLFQYDANQSFANVPVTLNMTEPWINRNSNQIYINDHFPLGYFSDPNVPFSIDERYFWASKEASPGQNEDLQLDFGANRNINYLEFEISTKPISFTITYLNNSSQWVEVSYLDDHLLDAEREVMFTSSSNSWRLVQIPFTAVNARYIKVNFTRKSTPFPYSSSPLSEWSIEVRGLRAANVIMNLTDFTGTVDPNNANVLIGDGGLDVLGNAYRTTLEPERYSASKTIDSELNTFWQSQANPSKFAVESLYLDIRSTPILDNFNRDNSTGMGSKWSSLYAVGTEPDFDIVSNQAKSGATYRSSAYLPIQPGPDCEVWYQVITPSIDQYLHLRVNAIGVNNFNGYYLQLNTGQVKIQRSDTSGGGQTNVVLNVTNVTVKSGDYLKLKAVGSTISSWRSTDGISWTLIFSVTDTSPHLNAGYMGIEGANGAIFDNFGGGTVGGPSTIDEIYIDPITSGCLMHIYWSNDDQVLTPPLEQTQDDWRLWVPIPRHYILSKGYHSFGRSITAKFLKLEFTKLNPQPYRALDITFKPIRYRTHPTWAQDYIFGFNSSVAKGNTSFDFVESDVVTLDYINLGIFTPEFTKFNNEVPSSIEDFQATANDSFRSIFDSYQTWVKKNEDTTADKYINVQIFTDLFSESLPNSLSTFNFVNRFLLQDDPSSLFGKEVPLIQKDLLDLASKNDRTLADEEKKYPDMWFPRTARHAYKILDAPRTNEVGYNVAIREISVFRVDHSSPSDQPFYIDPLSDNVNIASTNFIRADWRFIVSNTFFGEPTSVEVGVGDEDFDILTVGR